jgi:hypothetical protein
MKTSKHFGTIAQVAQRYDDSLFAFFEQGGYPGSFLWHV